MPSDFSTNKAKKLAADALVALPGLKAILVRSTYTPNRDHSFLDSITTHEASTTGYVAGYGNAGRKALANVVAAQDDANDRASVDFDPVVWSAIGVGGGYNVRYLVVGQEIGGSDASSPLLAIFDLNGDNEYPLSGGQFTFNPHADGALLIT